MTFGEFVNKVIKGNLGFNKPSIETDSGATLYDEDDEDDSAPNLLKKMSEFYMTGNAIVTVDDSSQCFKVDIMIVHRVNPEQNPNEPAGFKIVGAVAPEEAKTEEADVERAAKRQKVHEDSDDDVVCL